RNDLTRISLLASFGLLVFFIVAFRRLQIMILVMLPLSVGMLAGVAVNLLLFQRIHGLTLAFGAPLLGVCIDYAIHLFNAHCLLASKDRMRHIWPGILIGGLTTVAGFAGLAWTSFPGLREIAVFTSVGV